MIRFFLLNLLFIFFLLNQPVLAHGGEDHTHEEKKNPVLEKNQTQTSLFLGKKLEILIRYSIPEVETDKNIQLFLTDRETNQSVSGVLVSTEIEGRKFEFPETTINGLYEQQIKFSQPGSAQIKGTINGEKINENFSLNIEVNEKRKPKNERKKGLILLWISFLSLLSSLVYLLKNEKFPSKNQTN